MRQFVLTATLILTLIPLSACGGGGSDGDALPFAPRAVGAAFVAADGRIALVSKTGDRIVYLDVDQGTFSEMQLLSDALPGVLVELVGSAADSTQATAGEIRFADQFGESSIMYNPISESSSALTAWNDLGADDAVTQQVGAMMQLGSSLFVFNAAGSKYAALNLSTGSWSPLYEFISDFGGGGTPISAVGAAYVVASGDIYLFDHSGTRWTVYSGGGTFSPAYTLDELGDGTLSFN